MHNTLTYRKSNLIVWHTYVYNVCVKNIYDVSLIDKYTIWSISINYWKKLIVEQ